MNKITSVHDKFIRAILSDQDIAVDYFKTFLPPSLSEELDFSTLVQLPDSYLSKRLQKTMSDIVYSCKRTGSEEKVKVSLLVEHKSRPDRFAAVQIGGYIFSGLQKQLDSKEELSLIVPVLLYHGMDKWEYMTLSDLFTNIEEDWRKFIPDFHYIYNDLSLMPDEHLESLSNQFLAASFLAMKHAMDEIWLNDNAVDVFTRAVTGSGNLLEQFAVYFFENSKPAESRVFEILELVPEPIKDRIMNTFDVFERKGLQRGLEQGLEKGLEQGLEKGLEQGLEKGKENFVRSLLINTDFPASKIAVLAETSEEFVLRVQSSLKA